MAPVLLRRIGDEVGVVMLQHRYHPGLQGMTDVVGLDDGVGFGVELPLEVVEHRARAATTPGCVFAQRMQFLRRMLNPRPGSVIWESDAITRPSAQRSARTTVT